MNRSDFKKWLINNMSYDGSGWKLCPHCGKVIDYGYRYLDKKGSLAYNILQKLGFKQTVITNMKPILFDLLDSVIIDPHSTVDEDSETIIELLIENFPVQFDE